MQPRMAAPEYRQKRQRAEAEPAAAPLEDHDVPDQVNLYMGLGHVLEEV